MHAYVANTDNDWFDFLAARPQLDEVNFWRPGKQAFRSLQRGAPFFFKLKAPRNAIAGFGLFSNYQRMPVWQAWEVFGEANGVGSEAALRTRLGAIAKRNEIALGADHHVGCITVTQAVFFKPDEWVRLPSDYAPNIVSGKRYDLSSGEGKRIWEQCLAHYAAEHGDELWVPDALKRARTGKPQLIEPRLGQASFRIDVQNAYRAQCAVTTEHSLPVLEAAHIKPWGQGGENTVSNGLFLRSDLHRLFDRGYVTVDEDHRFVVSPALREEWHNGKAYYELHGRRLVLPESSTMLPSEEHLTWHRESVFAD